MKKTNKGEEKEKENKQIRSRRMTKKKVNEREIKDCERRKTDEREKDSKKGDQENIVKKGWGENKKKKKRNLIFLRSTTAHLSIKIRNYVIFIPSIFFDS